MSLFRFREPSPLPGTKQAFMSHPAAIRLDCECDDEHENALQIAAIERSFRQARPNRVIRVRAAIRAVGAADNPRGNAA